MTSTSVHPAEAAPSWQHHVDSLIASLHDLEAQAERISHWAGSAAACLAGGGRLLAAGNGGSAAQVQHLTSELVGRYQEERRPLSALALHADTSSVTAIGNDYGADMVFARQVLAHGRPGDLLVVLSTSGRSPNIVSAVETAGCMGLPVLALTGPRPNPVCSLADDAVCVDAESTATIQEVHQVVIHLLCSEIEARLPPWCRT